MAQMICPHPITSLSFCPLHLLTVFKLHGPPHYSSDTPGPLLPEGFALALLSAWESNLHLPTWPAPLSLSNPFSNLTFSTRPTRSMPFNKEICPVPHSTPPHPWHFESLLLCFNYFPQRIYHLLAYHNLFIYSVVSLPPARMFYSLMHPKALEQHLAHTGFLHSTGAYGEFHMGQHWE